MTTETLRARLTQALSRPICLTADTWRAAYGGAEVRLRWEETNQLTAAVLAELGDDLIDDDAVADPGDIRITNGAATEESCPACHRSTLLRLTTYTTLDESVIRIGEMALCQGCGYSPYAHAPAAGG
ncbi:hypothetical protein [Streptomonospora litoralis]|uniref:Uncharacterized protein n=1 Tax=Streptomonospora litoralis TaxID=2498135 RepID=A0A4P6Q8M9_9ACTN|nr:hypothetical protein [Streptomonospora litoralis]QBI56840.1 hypothetical protein EKD16_25500 [Streptomonospora litoralis]